MSQSFIAAALTYYLASVFKNSYSGKKADKSPWKQQGALKWEQGNYHPMAKWFIAHHELFSLARIFTLAIVIALSLSTGAYMIDEAIITGKNGGVPLAENRSDALFKLDTIQGAPEFGPELVALVETVMYGAPRSHPTTNGQAAVIVGHLSLPSTYALVNNKYSLESLKLLSNTLHEQLDLTPDAPTRRGRFFVFDYLSFPHSNQAVNIMAGSGLTPGSICLRTDQLPNMCGYLCAGVALLLHDLGLEFADIPCARLPALNSQAFLEAANARLNIQSNDATQLLGDQILGLASIMQAEANAGSNDVGWMHSPSPYNYWHTFFMRTLTNPAYHGTVHIMAVNSDSQHSLHATTAGTHWFLAAWFIEPEDHSV